MSDDLIRRSDAIKAIEELPNAYNGWSDAYDKAYIISTLEEVPSADRPQGEWIKYDEERDYCSHCKHIFKTRDITQQDKWTQYIDDLGYNYCPNCGCRMKGADDE